MSTVTSTVDVANLFRLGVENARILDPSHKASLTVRASKGRPKTKDDV